MLRADHALYLYKPADEPEEQKLGNPSGNVQPAPELVKTLTMKIGGVAGLGSSEAKSTITLDKLRF